MPTNREIENFVELSLALDGAGEMLSAARRFMERNGIGVMGRTSRATSGNGHTKRLSPALVERVKRTYTRRLPVPLRQTSDISIPAAPKRKLTHTEQKLEGRRISAALLESLDRVEPRNPTGDGRKALGALVRRGYAKKKGDGYVRTAKVFKVGDKPAKTPFDAPNAVVEGQSDALTVAEAAKVLGVSDSYVRLIVKGGKMTARTELRPRRGMYKPAPTMVLDRAELARYTVAEQAASS